LIGQSDGAHQAAESRSASKQQTNPARPTRIRFRKVSAFLSLRHAEVSEMRGGLRSGKVWLTEVRYGSSPIEFGDGRSSLECGATLEDVVKTLKLVSDAAAAGELDRELGRLASKRSRVPSAPNATPAASRKRPART
jgi:hypothetical protein